MREASKRADPSGIRSRNAVQLTQAWTESLWRQIEQLLARTVAEAAPRPDRPVRRSYQRQRRLNPDEVVELVAAYEEGASVRQLTLKYGIRQETVSRWLSVNGVEKRPLGASLTGDRLDEALLLRELDWSYARIADHLGISRSTVRRAVLSAH